MLGISVSGKSQVGIAESVFGGASVEVVKAGKRKRKKRESSKDTISAPIGQKDQTLFIFRALGRVLYAKSMCIYHSLCVCLRNLGDWSSFFNP